jgi:hypothetical protein
MAAGRIQLAPQNPERGKYFFLSCFIFACCLFWWLPSILFRIVVRHSDAVDDRTIAISISALALFLLGYLLPMRGRPSRAIREPILDSCRNFAYRATALLLVPSLLAALSLWYSRVGASYGSGDAIPRPLQALLYTHLFFGFMFLGSSNPESDGWRRVALVSIEVTLPRLIVSLHGGRFFLAQAVVPALLIAFARGWMRVSGKRAGQLVALALAIIFIPAVTRGDDLYGQDQAVNFFAAGSSLLLFQQNTDLSLEGRCPPLVVSLTAKTIPYGLLNQCVLDIGGLKRMPATLGRILTINDPTTFDGTAAGTGSNYLLDLFLFGGMPAVCFGSILFGLSSRRFVAWIASRSLFAGIWAECLTRALFAPRNDLGYVYERIPSLVLATVSVILVVKLGRILVLQEPLPERVVS